MFTDEFGTHKVLQQGLTALDCMEHRGACGGDGISGDGAGIMTQIPWKLFSEYRSENCPKPGVGMVFLPQQEDRRNKVKEVIENVCNANELEFLGWREVPVDPSALGPQAREAVPSMWQLFVKAPKRLADDEESRDGFERTLYLVRRRILVELEKAGLKWDDANSETYFASFSSSTIVYKGMVQGCVYLNSTKICRMKITQPNLSSTTVGFQRTPTLSGRWHSLCASLDTMERSTLLSVMSTGSRPEKSPRLSLMLS
jgi:glutamate synthase (ferredoxin)